MESPSTPRALRALSVGEIVTQLELIDDVPGRRAGYSIGDTTILRKIDGKFVKYCSPDLYMPIHEFSRRILWPLVSQPRDGLLNQRGATHGNYMTMAASIQAIKDVLHRGSNWDKMHSGHKEALELIATKIGRIIEGDPGFEDHWVDGAGYFTKGAEVCAAYKKG